MAGLFWAPWNEYILNVLFTIRLSLAISPEIVQLRLAIDQL
jgi:hypothetical protein